MIRHIHHPSCPAAHTAGAPCVCPSGTAFPIRRRRTQLADALAFAAMLGVIVGIAVYLLWKGTS